MTTANTQAVTKAAKPTRTLQNLLEGDQFKDALAKSLPSHLKPDRFVRIALTALTRTPKLAECEQASFFQCLLTLSQLGIEPDGRRAHLIPFKNTKRQVVECQLIVDYKGLAELAMRSGVVSNLHADLICENDQFEYNLGEVTKHVIDFRKPRGKAYAVYALCRFKDGSQKFEVMTREDVEDVRGRSKAAESGPWVTDWAEMAKKTVFRRLSKWLPLSPEYRDALDVDADNNEERRFQAATPVFANPSNTPLFEAPEPTEQLPASDDSNPDLNPAKPPQKTPKVEAINILTARGIEFDEFRGWLTTTGTYREADSCASFDDVPSVVYETLMTEGAVMLAKVVKIYAKGGK